MIFTRKNIKSGDIIRNKKGKLYFITEINPEYVQYETEEGWKQGNIEFNIEGDLITDEKEIESLLKYKDQETNKDKQVYQEFRTIFDLRISEDKRKDAINFIINN